MTFDLAIIGGGPAGISAAMQACRFGLRTCIIEKTFFGGQALTAPWIENYPGFSCGVTGKKLAAAFNSQLNKLSVEKMNAEAFEISQKADDDGSKVFCVHTSTGKINCKCVVVAVGLTAKKLGLPNEFAYGDPDFIPHENKKVLIVGGGDSAFDLAIAFSKKARSVCVCMRGDKPRAIPRLVEKAVLCGVEILSSFEPEKIAHDVLVSCIGKTAESDFLKKTLRNLGTDGFPIEGVFLAGDIAHEKERHIAIAVGDGVLAAERACRYIWR